MVTTKRVTSMLFADILVYDVNVGSTRDKETCDVDCFAFPCLWRIFQVQNNSFHEAGGHSNASATEVQIFGLLVWKNMGDRI